MMRMVCVCVCVCEASACIVSYITCELSDNMNRIRYFMFPTKVAVFMAIGGPS